jgi:hypothetical protein
MLSKETIEKLKGFGLDMDKLSAAIKAPGEVPFEVPVLNLFSEEQLAERDVNIRAEGHRGGVAEGKTAGLEIAAKTFAKKFNVPAEEVGKDLDKVIEKVHAALAKGDPELQKQVNLLQQDKDELNRKLEQTVVQHNTALFDSTLITSMPVKRSPMMTDAEYLMAVKANLEFVDVDGKKVVKVKATGEEIRHDTTKAPLPINEAIGKFFTDRKWISAETPDAPGGRGGKDNPPAGGSANGLRTMKAVKEKFKEEFPNKSFLSAEFQTYYAGIVSKTPDFDDTIDLDGSGSL